MYIKKIFETPEGTVEFEGELSGEELALIVEVGYNYLLAQGALTVQKPSEDDVLQ